MSSSELTTTIHGYTVYLNLNANGDGSTYCHVEKGKHCASLELLDAFGHFDDGAPVAEVPMKTLDAIREWAEGNGY